MVFLCYKKDFIVQLLDFIVDYGYILLLLRQYMRKFFY